MRRLLRDYRARCRTPPPAARPLPARRRRAQGGRRRAASARAPGSSCCSGRDDGDPLFLQVKEARRLRARALRRRRRGRANQGKRVVEGQQLMQAGERHPARLAQGRRGIDGKPRDFYVRQLWDSKGSAEVERMDARALRRLRRDLRLDAGPRPRPLRRPRRDRRLPRATATAFDRAIADFAEAYADQNERDYAALAAAARDGRSRRGRRSASSRCRSSRACGRARAGRPSCRACRRPRRCRRRACRQRVAERLLDQRAHDRHVLGVRRQRVRRHHPAALGGELRRRRRTRRSCAPRRA